MTVAGNAQLSIGGDVSGQIAIGNNIMQIQNNGGVVYVVKNPTEQDLKSYLRLFNKDRVYIRPCWIVR